MKNITWKRTRREFIEKLTLTKCDLFDIPTPVIQCMLCKNVFYKINIQVHHLNSRKKRPDLMHNHDNLIALCPKCHKRMHQDIKKFELEKSNKGFFIAKKILDTLKKENIKKYHFIKMDISSSGFNYCKRLERIIDDDLINKMKPPCIKKNNGCGNCIHVEYELMIQTNEVIKNEIY